MTIISKYKASSNIEKQINIDRKRILESKEVLNWLEINDKNNSLITFKDRKGSTVRFRNPAKNELGRFNITILGTANKNTREAVNLN